MLYLLSKDKPHGYFWLMLGNITCAGLMGIQAHWLLLAEHWGGDNPPETLME